MTTEEFEGHLLACLHGPNAGKIAELVLAVALANKDVAKVLGFSIGEAVAAATSGIDEAIFELAVLAHVSELRPKRADTVGDIMKVTERKRIALKLVRDRLAASVRELPDAERIAETFMLDLNVAAHPAGD